MYSNRKPKMVKKIGFSASRCIRDICEGKVKLHDVVMITTGTNCPDIETWLKVMEAYATLSIWDERSLAGLDPELVKEVAIGLWHQGKVHQPRVMGSHRTRNPFVWMDLVHTKEDRDANPVLAQAWERAQTIEALVAPELSDYDAYEQDMEELAKELTKIVEESNENQSSK